MKLSEITHLGEDEGYAGRIPGFRGLIATGATKKETLAELETALVDWINLTLKRGLGFLNWLKRNKRIVANPLESVPKVDLRGRQRKHRAITQEELPLLLKVPASGAYSI